MINVSKKQFQVFVVVVALSSMLLLLTGCPCGLASNLTISPSRVEMLVGKQLKLGIKSKCLIHREFEWTSENPNVVSVSPEGIITAEGVGETTVTVRGCNGLAKATADVVVVEEPPLTAVQGDVILPFAGSMKLGAGMDVTSGSILGNIFDSYSEKVEDFSTETVLEFQVHESLDSLRTSMDLSYKSSLELGVESTSAEYKATAGFSSDVHTIYGVVKWFRSAKKMGAENLTIDSRVENLYASDYGIFHRDYGDYYLDQIELAASFYGFVRIKVSNTTETATVSAKLQEKVGLYKSDAEMHASLDAFQHEYNIDCYVFSKGGPDSGKNIKVPGFSELFDALAEYRDQVDKDFDDTTKTAEELAKEYSHTAIFKPYHTIKGLDNPSLDFAASNDSMNEIAWRYHCFEELKAKLDFIHSNWDSVGNQYAEIFATLNDLEYLLYTLVPEYQDNLERLAKAYSPEKEWTADLSDETKYPDPQSYLDNVSANLHCRDCQDYADLLPNLSREGEHMLYVDRDPAKQYTAYCRKVGSEMHTFLILKNCDSEASTSPHYNYASQKCLHTVYPQVCSGISQYTVFQRIRIVRNEGGKIHVVLHDFTDSESTPPGANVAYATAFSCGEHSNNIDAYKGKANIDLRGTNFAVSTENQWHLSGYGSELAHHEAFSDNNQVVDITMSGYCGSLGVSGDLVIEWVGE